MSCVDSRNSIARRQLPVPKEFFFFRQMRVWACLLALASSARVVCAAAPSGDSPPEPDSSACAENKPADDNAENPPADEDRDASAPRENPFPKRLKSPDL